ncbi:MAG: bifunctional GrpB family protein/GNAT family N-acetyltransferase [Lachnospiraceae bacterium]|nr:bifunctional GrpB family protein/GNAT family N-acetyltransferase [Lachnospiraceae bacterium]
MMGKELKDMTLEELWELFPVVLEEYNPQWKNWAEEEIRLLSEKLASFLPVVSHIGSTAIVGIQAKPIVDLLVEVSPECDWNEVKDVLEMNGYICMSESPSRMSFNKGYTVNGFAEKVFHVHICVAGNKDEVYFRDYLISHPEIAAEYESLKMSLLPEYRNDRDGYTEAKSEFVKRITSKAKSQHESLRELKIDQVSSGIERLMPLLLIGDESEEMIGKYLPDSIVFVGMIGCMEIAVCAAMVEPDGWIEIKNLAVAPEMRRRGIGKAMLSHVESVFKGKKFRLGTGETPSTLRFYQSCGYSVCGVVPDFFTLNYDHPIIEEGVRLKDMIYLMKNNMS